jgi:glutathione S-transferase
LSSRKRPLDRAVRDSGMVPYGDLDTTMNVIVAQLGKGPRLLGDKFTAADVLWGTALTQMTGFGLVEAVLPIKSLC